LQPQQQQQQGLSSQLSQNPMLGSSGRPSVNMHSASSSQPPSAYSQHHSSSLIDGGLNHHPLNLLGNINTNNNNLGQYVDPRDQHYQQVFSSSNAIIPTNNNNTTNINNPGLSPSPQPRVEA
jgi:hypothetical protein